MMEKFSQAGEGGEGLHAHPLSLYLPSRTMLHFMPQLRGQIQSPSFMYSVWVPLFLPPPWPANHKVRIYKEYHSVWPLVGIGTLPTPLSPASEPLPQNRGGGHTRLRVRGWGSPNSYDWKNSIALCTANPAIRTVLNQITLPFNCLITEILAVL